MKRFFQISKNRSILLLMVQLDLLSYSYLIVRTVRVASGKTKRLTNTALEATGQKKKNHTWLTRPRSPEHNTRGRVE